MLTLSDWGARDGVNIRGLLGSGNAGTGAGNDDVFNEPTGIAIAPDGKNAYVVDTGNERVVKVSLDHGINPVRKDILCLLSPTAARGAPVAID